VIPEDIVDLFPETVAHRVTLTRQAMASGTTAEAILRDILAATPVPFLSRANV
jgi:MoxR-like ATPase